jgi:hypothetical protein
VYKILTWISPGDFVYSFSLNILGRLLDGVIISGANISLFRILCIVACATVVQFKLFVRKDKDYA